MYFDMILNLDCINLVGLKIKLIWYIYYMLLIKWFKPHHSTFQIGFNYIAKKACRNSFSIKQLTKCEYIMHTSNFNSFGIEVLSMEFKPGFEYHAGWDNGEGTYNYIIPFYHGGLREKNHLTLGVVFPTLCTSTLPIWIQRDWKRYDMNEIIVNCAEFRCGLISSFFLI